MPINFAAVAQQRQGLGSANTPPIPAPIGGLNTRDSVTLMPPTDAIIMDNIFPDVDGVKPRNGSSSYATALGGAVEFAEEYHSGATRKFIAASGGSIYDISTPGTATLLQSGFNSAQWNHVNFNARMILVNGADDPQTYYTGTVSASGFSGTNLTVSNLVGVASFKNRLFFFENDSQDFWYAALNAITGTLTKFPLSLVGRVGGNLVAIKTISRDGGAGADDYIAFIMSSGEAFVYQGSDPGDSDNWSLVGRYQVGEPIHQRAALEYGNDVKIVTKGDVVNFSDVITKKPEEILPSKLSGAIATASRDYGSNYGWQTVYYPKGNMVLINVPVTYGVEYWQYGYNTITGAAFRFKGMNAMCLGVYNGELYYGSASGIVYKADTGTSDAGTAIEIDIQQAFHNGGGGGRKAFKQAVANMQIEGAITFTVSYAFDYGRELVSYEYTNSVIGTPWGSPWGSPWSVEGYVSHEPIGLSDIGTTISIRLRASLTAQTFTWFDTAYKFNQLTKF